MKTFLFILLLYVAVTAILSGLVLVLYPDGSVINLHVRVLEQTPFEDFQVPGLLLAVVVGITNLLAAIKLVTNGKRRLSWAMAGGAVLCGWITVQLLLIQLIYWLHFAYLGIGILIILLAYQLKGKWVV